MNVMLYGTKKCAGTRAVERWFRERRIPFQFRDTGEKSLTEGELRNLSAGHRIEDLIDTASKSYASRGLAYMESDPLEELLRDGGLLATPVVRVDRVSLIRPTPQELEALIPR
jgi:arsenate reductase (glutaredoxin)